MTTKAAPRILQETLTWLTSGDRRPAPPRSPVHIRDRRRWLAPPSGLATGHFTAHVVPGTRVLVPEPRSGPAARSTFTFDPRRTHPHYRRPIAVQHRRLPARRETRRARGCAGVHRRAAGEDVYAYGAPVVELDHETDNPHIDLFVRVSEVDRKAGMQRQ